MLICWGFETGYSSAAFLYREIVGISCIEFQSFLDERWRYLSPTITSPNVKVSNLTKNDFGQHQFDMNIFGQHIYAQWISDLWSVNVYHQGGLRVRGDKFNQLDFIAFQAG